MSKGRNSHKYVIANCSMKTGLMKKGNKVNYPKMAYDCTIIIYLKMAYDCTIIFFIKLLHCSKYGLSASSLIEKQKVDL